jgi:hypothetical protein
MRQILLKAPGELVERQVSPLRLSDIEGFTPIFDRDAVPFTEALRARPPSTRSAL